MARAMMSLTTSLGRPFSAESCARPVTSSRFTALPSKSSIRVGRQKKWGRPTFRCPTRLPARPETRSNYIKWRESGGPLPLESGLAAAPLLCEVVSDVREIVRQLVAEKNHRNNHDDGDDRNDECVFD